MESHSMADIYHDTLLQNDSVNNIVNIITRIDYENYKDIDFIVQSVNDIYVKAASQILIFKKKSSQPFNKRKRAKLKKPWITKDCLLLRKEVRSLG